MKFGELPRDEKLLLLHTLLKEKVAESITLREQIDKIRKNIRKVQATR